MLRRTTLPRLLTLAMVLVAGYVFGWPSDEAQAQQAQQGSQIKPFALDLSSSRQSDRRRLLDDLERGLGTSQDAASTDRFRAAFRFPQWW